MRIAIAGFALESVSFLPGEAGVEVFEREACRGPELVAQLRGSATVGGGFIEVLEAAGIEIVPIVYTDCAAAGHAADAAFDAYAREIYDTLAAQAEHLDGVLLYLHGSMTTPKRNDPELEIVRQVRAIIGARVPLMVALDLHANLSAARRSSAFTIRRTPTWRRRVRARHTRCLPRCAVSSTPGSRCARYRSCCLASSRQPGSRR
jgi:microcystin degradation protein MlrC